MRRLILLLALLLLPGAAFAGSPTRSALLTTTTLKNGVNGYTGCMMTFINGGAADSTKNFGAADSAYVSGAAYTGYHAGQNKILIYFDVSSLADTSKILVEAKIYLYQSAGNSGAVSDTLELQRIYPSWLEGDGPAAGDTTFNSAKWHQRRGAKISADGSWTNGGRWSSPGASATVASVSIGASWGTGDSASVNTFTGQDTTTSKAATNVDVSPLSRSITFAKTGAAAAAKKGWISFDVTRQVDLWCSGANAPNNGWVLRVHNNTSNKAFVFNTDDENDDGPSNGVTDDYRPYLVATYLDKSTLGSSGSSTTGNGRRTLGGQSGLH